MWLASFNFSIGTPNFILKFTNRFADSIVDRTIVTQWITLDFDFYFFYKIELNLFKINLITSF